MEDYRILISFADSYRGPGIIVKIMKKVASENNKFIKYDTVFDNFVAPFLIGDDTLTQGGNSLSEIVNKLNLNKYEFDNPSDGNMNALLMDKSKAKSVEPVETTVSHGFHLKIPEIGSILITHNGDLALNIYNKSSNQTEKRSLHIETPRQVILNTTSARHLDLDIISSNIVLAGKSGAIIHSLTFHKFHPNDNLMQGLFIDAESFLNCTNLYIEDSLVLLLGSLIILNELTIDGGYIFNMSELNLYKQAQIDNISYFFNGTKGKILNPSQLNINSNVFSNLGTIDIKTGTISTQKIFDNQGVINVLKEGDFTFTGECNFVNSKVIQSKEGRVLITTNSFTHKNGLIESKELEISSNSSLIESKIIGTKAIFRNNTLNKSLLTFNDITISGTFLNKGQLRIQDSLILTDELSHVVNTNIIETGDVVSNSLSGIIEGGKCTAKSFKVNRNLLANACFPELDYIQVDESGILVLPVTNKNKALKRITNNGKAQILSECFELTSIENGQNAVLQLEVNILSKVTSFENISGKSDIKAKFKNLKVLKLPKNAQMNLMKGTKILYCKSLIIGEGSQLNIEEDIIAPYEIETIYNFGKIICQIPLISLKSIYNGPKAELFLLEETRVHGREINNNDTQIFKTADYFALVSKCSISTNKSKEEGLIGVYNEGKILVSSSTKSLYEQKTNPLNKTGYFGRTMLQFVPNDKNSKDISNKNLSGLKISQKYVATENAILVLQNSAIISAQDFLNYGAIYSSEKLKIDILTEISRFGILASKEEIDLNVIQKPLLLDGSFIAIVEGENKTVNIESETEIIVTNENNMNIDLYIRCPAFMCKGILKMKSFFILTNEFFIDQAQKDSEKFAVATIDGFEIYTKYFINNGGKMKTEGKKHSKIFVDQLFKNTGGGEISRDHQKITWYTIDNNCQLKANIKDISTGIYKPHFDRAGLIATAGSLEINVGSFDNSFGIIRAGDDLRIESSSFLNNESGMIYSEGKTIFKGDSFDNGYKRGNQAFVGVDPNRPIKEVRMIKEEINDHNWESFLFMMHTRSCSFLSAFMHLIRGYIIQPKQVVVGYEQNVQYAKLSKYPGYIFSEGDIDIDTAKPCYIGTIVSQGDIRFKGKIQNTCNNSELGKIIARGNITIELNNIKLEQISIEAENACIKLIEDLVIQGVIMPIQTDSGRITSLIDLSKFSEYIGLTIPQTTFRLQGDNRVGPGKLISLNPNIPIENDVLILPTADTGFINKIESNFFVSSLQNSVLNQLIRLILTPLEGRDVLLRIDLIDELRKKGSSFSSSFKKSQEMILKNSDTSLIFQKLENQDVELEFDGEKVQVPLCNPYLIVNTVSRLMTGIHVNKTANIETLGNIKYGLGKVDIEAENLFLHANKQIEIASEFVYTGFAKTGINQASIHIPGTLGLSGNQGVIMKGVDLLANQIQIKSSNGNIYDFEMPLDMKMNYDIPYDNWYTITGYQHTHTSTIRGNCVELIAPNGLIEQHGTTTFTGTGGIKIEGNYRFIPAYENSYYFERRHKKYAKSNTTFPKEGGILSAGNVLFLTKDATLIGATIIAPKIINPIDGNIRFLPAFIDQHNWSYEEKSNMFGSSSVEIVQDRQIPVGCKILANEFLILGSGTLEMEGITAKIINATITKNINERAAYETSHTVITQKASGFCPPKINGDAFINSFNNISKTFTCFEDSAAGVFNMASSFFTQMEHLDILMNLGVIENPISSIAKILLSRFVSSFTYSNIETKTTIDMKNPVQSKFDIEVLRVSNDRTHLEGVYNIKDKAVIETSNFETKAPEREFHSHSETHGYSISLNPVALGCACIDPTVLSVGAALPTVSVINVSQDVRKKDNAAQVLTADDLFIRCDNAVFSGSKIQARLVEAIVSGDLTIEDLTNEFISETHNSTFSINLGGVFSLIHNISVGNEASPQQQFQKELQNTIPGELRNSVIGETFTDPAWTAIPQIRIADEKEITREVQHLSSFIGREKFYLKVAGCLHKKSALVGLVDPDGFVIHNENEKIEAGTTIDEEIAETHYHEKHVVRPCVAEFVGMMSSFASLQKTDNHIEYLKKDIERKEKNKAINENLSVDIAEKKGKEKGKKFQKDTDKIRDKCKELDNLVDEYSKKKKEEQESKNNTENSKLSSETQKDTVKNAANLKAASQPGKTTSNVKSTTTNSNTSKPAASASGKPTSNVKNTTTNSNTSKPAASASGKSTNNVKSTTTNSNTSKPAASTSGNPTSNTKTTNIDNAESKSNLSMPKTDAENIEQKSSIYIDPITGIEFDTEELIENKYELHNQTDASPRLQVENWKPEKTGGKIAKYIVELWYDCKKYAEEHPTAAMILDAALNTIDRALTVLGLGWGTLVMYGVDWLFNYAFDKYAEFVSPTDAIKNEVYTALVGFKDRILQLINIGVFTAKVLTGKSLTKDTVLDKNHISKQIHPIKKVYGFFKPEPKYVPKPIIKFPSLSESNTKLMSLLKNNEINKSPYRPNAYFIDPFKKETIDFGSFKYFPNAETKADLCGSFQFDPNIIHQSGETVPMPEIFQLHNFNQPK